MKQRISPGRSAGSLPRFLGESGAAERSELSRLVMTFAKSHLSHAWNLCIVVAVIEVGYSDWLCSGPASETDSAATPFGLLGALSSNVPLPVQAVVGNTPIQPRPFRIRIRAHNVRSLAALS